MSETQLSVPANIPRHSVVFPVAFFLLVLLGLSALLISWRVESVVMDLATSRAWRQIKQVRDEMDSSFQVGLSIYDMKNLSKLLAGKKEEEPEMVGAMVVDDQNAAVAAVNELEIRKKINPIWTEQLYGRRGTPVERSIHQIGVNSLLGFNVVDPSGRVVAVIWMLYARTTVRQVSGLTLESLFVPTALAALVLLAIGVMLAFRLVRASELRLSRWVAATETANAGKDAKAFIAEHDL